MLRHRKPYYLTHIILFYSITFSVVHVRLNNNVLKFLQVTNIMKPVDSDVVILSMLYMPHDGGMWSVMYSLWSLPRREPLHICNTRQHILQRNICCRSRPFLRTIYSLQKILRQTDFYLQCTVKLAMFIKLQWKLHGKWILMQVELRSRLFQQPNVR